jgi:site-specific DNA-adenine methylase
MNFFPSGSSYVGAKATNAFELSQLFYLRDKTEYYSLFAGMMNDIIQAPLNGLKIYANDIDKGVYSLLCAWCDREKSRELYNQMLSLEFSEVCFNEAKDKIADREKLMLIPSEIERAKYMWVALLMSKNAQMKTFKGITDGLEQQRYQAMMLKKSELFDCLSRVKVLNEDAVDIINRLKATRRSDIFCYADPPYYGKNCTAKRHYRHDYTHDDHVRLLKAARDIQFHMMISNYDNYLYNQLLTEDFGWKRYEFKEVYKSMKYGGAGVPKTRVMEIIWTNYELKDINKDEFRREIV